MADENQNEETTDENVDDAVEASEPADVAEPAEQSASEEPGLDEPDAEEAVAEQPVAAEPAAIAEDAMTDEPAPEEPAAEVAEVAEPAEEPAAEAEEPAGAEEAETPVPAAAEPDAEAAPAQQVKKKKKRLPRALRPQRSKPKRERPEERKPISRLPKPEHVRGRSQERQGTVVSAAMDKTIVVRVDTVKVHPRYKKVIRRSSKLHAHDERNEAKVGDIVLIVETRPLSRMKRWRLQRVLEAAR
jgi:small subunit ribosomal protein S17